MIQHQKKHAGARLFGIGTALPVHRSDQSGALRFMSRAARAATGRGSARALEWMEKIYASSGISHRHSVLADYVMEDPEEFRFFPRNWALDPFPGTAARMKVYEKESVSLAERAALKALAEAGVPAGDVTHLIVSTCTGFFAPGPDILLIQKLGLRPDVKRYILGFMGCYAGFNGLRMADDIARARPEAVVLQICVELCSLHFQKKLLPDYMVANALFADGAGAAVYAAAERFPGGLADVTSTASAVQDDSLEQMSWHIGDTGFEMRLDRNVPATLKENAPAFLEGLLRGAGLSREEAVHWAIHPGGRKIVEGLQECFKLDTPQLDSSWEVLRDTGNMSSATILFVLDKELRRRGSKGPVIALGFGPGLTMEGAALEKL